MTTYTFVFAIVGYSCHIVAMLVSPDIVVTDQLQFYSSFLSSEGTSQGHDML